ncbi:hypothetical protein A3K01_02130 [candidate division WWE3 bacterium RIFOXYD1_FULL_43_17]|uniref:Uncharacterized protein n=3 Tax=Katanobacteria TaxID=422282 RepID=A0A1F4XE43_UNCKA|nr:MAG: hypothetical protein UU59_C0025G0008 [candidate division WWE3 bacterium GW2011_GWE1_41_27]KKS59713.1 MAG: hypothetical protein UV26_C0017G0008 [candidate division WWE3 bacterium GW2011_GWF2_42_42]OGC79910.1 MAG: hypothetical protein A3K01_02130 [candidate division WWE3 bacterium RIFOXYD1_FULL_43_17]
MRKGLLFFLIFPLLILGAYSLIRSYQPGLLDFLIGRDVTDGSVPKSTFSSYTEYVIDKDLGLYPGVKKINKGSEEFLEYVNDSTKASQIFTVYRMFLVEKVEDAQSGKVTLIDEGNRATYLFECSADRTSAHKSTNLQFISSGFDFNSTVAQGDSVFTKCKNEECAILGPDCIIIKKEL